MAAETATPRGALAEIDLASDTAWTLSADGGPARPIKVPRGGWNSDWQEPRIDTILEVDDTRPLVFELQGRAGEEIMGIKRGTPWAKAMSSGPAICRSTHEASRSSAASRSLTIAGAPAAVERNGDGTVALDTKAGQACQIRFR